MWHRDGGWIETPSRRIEIRALGEDESTDHEAAGHAVVGGLWLDSFGPAWMPRARAEFLRRADAMAQGSARELMLWPKAGGAVADAPSILSFVRARPRWKFILNPAGIMVPALLARAGDHLRRIFEVLGPSEALAAVVVSSCEVVGEELRAAPVGTNREFDAELAKWQREFVPASTPIVQLV